MKNIYKKSISYLSKKATKLQALKNNKSARQHDNKTTSKLFPKLSHNR